jgi:hypothetical protein
MIACFSSNPVFGVLQELKTTETVAKLRKRQRHLYEARKGYLFSGYDPQKN